MPNSRSRESTSTVLATATRYSILHPYSTYHGSSIPQRQQRAVTLAVRSLLLCTQMVPAGITAVNPTNSMPMRYRYFENQLTPNHAAML